MKKLITTSILAVLVSFATTVFSQEYPEEYLGLPGDNLNLYAVMKLFQESETLEGFERGLNDENNRINNLDLNGDNLIDYVTVTDYIDGNVHTIVLRVPLDRNESQDVAVFTVEKFRNGSVEIQLIGDEALYGRNYIIEPIYDETPNPGYMGNRANVTNVTIVRTTPYQVAAWPVVRFIYLPDYVVWRSSWYWGYYPPVWRPWRPYYWHYYYGYHYNWYHHYYVHYRFWDRPRYARYNDYYYRGIRAQSPRVYSRIKEGTYRETYSRPEQRREGETLFTKMHPAQTRRTAENTPVVRNVNSSVSRSSRERNGEATKQGAPAQSRATERTRERTTDRNTGTSTRTTTTARERTQERTTGQNPGTTTRTTTTTTERNRDQAANKNTGTTTRSTTTRVERERATSAGQAKASTRTTTVAKPERSRNTEAPKASKQSSRSERAESRQNAKASSRSNSESRKSDRSKESDNSNSSRRR